MLAACGVGLAAGVAASCARFPYTAGMALALVALPLSLWVIAGPFRWIKLLLFATIALPPLPVPVGNSGPHPAVAIALLGLAAAFVRPSGWQLRASLLNLSVVFFSGILAASVALAALYSGAAIAAGSLARVALFCIAVYVFFYVSAAPAWPDWEPGKYFRWLFVLASAGALFACLDFYFQFPAPAGFGPQFIWLDSGVFRRAQGVFYEASTLGNFCAFFLVMAAVALVRPIASRSPSRLILVPGTAVLAAALLMSYSRASLVNLSVAGLALLFLCRKKLRPIRIASIGVAATAGTAAAWLMLPTFVDLYLARIRASAEYFVSAPNAVLSGRLQSWKFLAEFLIANPWHAIVGIGYKTLPYSHYLGRAVVADNMYLSILVETGVVGFAAFLALNVAILRASYQAANCQDDARRFAGAWMFCFWAGEMVQMLSGDILTYWRVLPVYFFVIGLAVRPRFSVRP